MHKTIGEFLVAELICDGTTRLLDKRRLDRKELWEHRYEDQWTAVMFFWAGKTSPRELEEFLGDLLNEASEKATLLALSLLHDQGDRLTRETQRNLVSLLVTKPLSDSGGAGVSVCVTPSAPQTIFTEYSTASIDLRGLSEARSTQAFARFFELGLLNPALIQKCKGLMHDQLKVTVFWALSQESSKVTLLGVRQCLSHLPPRDVTVLCFRYTFYSSLLEGNGTLELCRRMLAEWLEQFPEGRPWVSLLMIGMLTDAETRGAKFDRPEYLENSRKLIGPLLWERLNEPVDADWLCGSSDCRGPFDRKHVDILGQARNSLAKTAPSEWDLTPEQLSNLQVWFGHMLKRRDQLMAAKNRHEAAASPHSMTRS